MRGVNINSCWVPLIFLYLVAFTLPSALSQDAMTVYDRIKNLAKVLAPDIHKHLNFCVKDVNTDWNRAFKFDDLGFLSDCMKSSKGEITNRICSAAEIKFLFERLINKGERVYVKPNNNCNLSSWVNGCEPGWGCALDDKADSDHALGRMPFRTRDCQPCCAGFFCPHGLTCMIPCPLGSYCPRATLNKTSGVCDPYNYQIPPGDKEHTCGGADTWAAASSGTNIFCSPGSYCPTTVQEESCSSGHFCRKGSTNEIGCFMFAQCSPNTAKQTLHIYGFIVIAGLAILLIFIYNCSDSVLSARERRSAKSRERAARKARQTVMARERWKMARELVKKRTTGFQTQLSRAMTRKKTPRSDPKGYRSSPKYSNVGNPSSPTAPSHSPSSSRERRREPNLSTMMQALEDDDPESLQGINVEIGDKNLMKKKMVTKGNTKQHYSTHSQQLSYAYGQMEKERVMQEKNKGLTYSGVISMATGNDNNPPKRPVIEVAFKDLTLTLKGKNRHLLRSVTGKFRAGRVSAVMGPSGAGKTTFLSALAGKVVGCTRTGFVLVNGRDESIRSYKKIVGFVPQDDILHGNLTVEENLKFSAECRLPANMPRPEKVLVIERVIDFLGLQAIRDSLVGTVEQRGISGGQKKRVNVGIEMVIEPSLLILDEPTSGLDSSSSMLLLRALRREALEGVNICMVLHQPSYSLFKMFDDLVLLAKGGLIAYQGPVKKVEEYFAGMEIIVPDRINPPDHFIDVLEGMVPVDSDVTIEQLPVRWMLHNHYHIPPDMLHHVDVISGLADPKPARPDYRKQQSLAEELWEDVKFNVGMKKDDIEHRLSNSKDLTNRVTPGVLKQYRFFLGRVGKQRLRECRLQVVDYLILLLAGGCLGFLAKVDDETLGARGYTFTVIAVSLLCKMAALRSFSEDRVEYWRGGMSSVAYFLSKDTIDHFNTVVKPVVYLSMFYFFNSPRSSFVDNYLVLLCLVYCVTGMAYVFAIWLDAASAQLVSYVWRRCYGNLYHLRLWFFYFVVVQWSVIVPLVLTLVANQDKDSVIVKRFGDFCYSKWALEGFIIANAERYNGVWLITRCDLLDWYGYDIHNKNKCLIVLIIYGVISRFVAYICLLVFQKK